ncbi:MAG: hypothetical protein M1822_004633 [Bathelium mastoideum]|nr:MAG: hypothetical protein M1822_004633 [Bathelium mastoideum]
MDVFVRGLPAQCTTNDLQLSLKDSMQKLGIVTYHCSKMRRKNCGTLTFLHSDEAIRFLRQHGTKEHDRRSRPLIQLTVLGKHIYCHESRYLSDEFMLRHLAGPNTAEPVPVDQSKPWSTFLVNSLACGNLDFAGQDPIFIPYFEHGRAGSITFAHKTLTIKFPSDNTTQILIPYHGIRFVGIGNYQNPTITLSLYWAPRIYYEREPDLPAMLTTFNLFNLNSNPRPQGNHEPKFVRSSSIDDAHALVVGQCLVYRIRFAWSDDISSFYQMLRNHQSPLRHSPWAPRTFEPHMSFAAELARLNDNLSAGRYGDLHFAVKFQVQRLAQNSILAPRRVLGLLPKISSLASSHGIEKTAEAIKVLARELPFVEPDTSSEDLATATLEEQLSHHATTYNERAFSVYELEKRHPHLVLIYRAQITPSGTFLEGPDEDVTNRVLRKYPDHIDHFMRVEFLDDDGGPIKFERAASRERIFHGRFKHVLATGIHVAGRVYNFLGFSHSSLRNQAVWFQAAFWDKPTAELMLPQILIGRLGDFSLFQSPAKCAARIGQAFSDTSASIHIGQRGYKRIEDIERDEYVFVNGRLEPVRRNFSDGVGTLSWDLLRRVWSAQRLLRTLKPTALQIRFAGAKGMISLDTRLIGEVLNLRESMIKFESVEDWNLEICAEAVKPLPMFLNRPLIKILEDLGVESDALLRLQAQRISELRKLITHPLDAEAFLETNRVGQSTQIPLMIRMLQDIGLHYQADEFLRNFVEMAVLHRLREMKYRGRIPLDKNQGVTLYGIMDETGYLKEGEVYVPIQRSRDRRFVLTDGGIAVTRSPAMHPGDIQIVRAVDVPDDSPLSALDNCIVFSSQGTRDLPSQLSGGDLDGDQYHIIFAPELIPTRTHPAANYPRVAAATIGRTVEGSDMANFFIEFMENDRLGQISNTHQQLADQKDLGTRDPDCIKLAGLASVAVDFSKSGIPANMREMPKHSKCRPDFMAPGPRVEIRDHPEISLEKEDEGSDALLANEESKYVYYKSHKVLGKLYRMIDEHKFLEEVRKDAEQQTRLMTNELLLEKLWVYIRRYTMLLQRDHLRELASEIREGYEENLINLMWEYSTHPHLPLTEIEVVTGVVFGRSEGAQNKKLREACMEMKEQYSRDVEFTIRRILHSDSDTEEVREDALALATACFTLAMEEQGSVTRGVGEVKSFRYIAAAMCLKEIKKIQPDRKLA